MATSDLSALSASSTSKLEPVSVRSIEPVAVGWSSVYQANHQVQYLKLQAEMDTLLLELKAIKSQRSATLATR
jgi:hypothetical protein